MWTLACDQVASECCAAAIDQQAGQAAAAAAIVREADLEEEQAQLHRTQARMEAESGSLQAETAAASARQKAVSVELAVVEEAGRAAEAVAAGLRAGAWWGKPLCDCVRRRQSTALKELLALPGSDAAAWHKGLTPLHLAADRLDLRAVTPTKAHRAPVEHS